VMPGGVVYCRTAYTKYVLLLVSIELIPFREKPEIPNSELIELAMGEGTKVCSSGDTGQAQFST
jgi:hypothetical protein